jgi:hypothetical protein
MCSVRGASAESRVNGSKELALALRRRAFLGLSLRARLSARKMASNLPRSSVCTKRR